MGETLKFEFTMANDITGFNFDTYGSVPNIPQLVFRIQGIADPGNVGSDKAYGWVEGGGDTPPVPEPALIAPLSVLGLGGLLFIRRRIKGKAKKA